MDFNINGRNPEIIAAIQPAFPKVLNWQSGGNIYCPRVEIGANGAYALITDAEYGDQSVMVGYYGADGEDEDGDESLVLSRGTIEQAVAMLFALRARDEILGDFEQGELADVHNWTDLHGVCDANMYLVPALEYAQKHLYPHEPFNFMSDVAEYIGQLGTFNHG